MSQADYNVKSCQNLAISNPKADLHNINAHTKFGENSLTFTKVVICPRQITAKNWQKLPINNPKPDLHNINAHTKFDENPLTQVIIWKQKYGWMDEQPMRYHNTPPLVVGYKKQDRGIKETDIVCKVTVSDRKNDTKQKCRNEQNQSKDWDTVKEKTN